MDKPTDMARKEVNKRLADMIADKMMNIKRLQAEIKKLEKEIQQIESGELAPAPIPQPFHPEVGKTYKWPFTVPRSPYTDPHIHGDCNKSLCKFSNNLQFRK